MALTRLPPTAPDRPLDVPARTEQVIDLPRPYWTPSDRRQSVLVDGTRVLLRHKGLFLFILLMGGVLGYVSTLPRAPVYRARTLLDIQPLNENFFSMKSSESQSTTAATSVDAESFLQTQIKLLQSNSVVARVVNKLRSRPASEATTSLQAEVAQAASTFKVRPVGATRLVEVLCDGPSPQQAMVFCNTLANEFIENSLEVRSDTASRTSQWLGGQLSDLRQKLATSEENLQTYARSAALMFSPDKETIAQERLRGLQNELTRAQSERIAKQSRYELAMTEPTDSLMDAADSQVFREYSLRLTDLQRQRAELSVMLTADHPRVQKLDAQIAELRAGLSHERNEVVARAKNELDASRRREVMLQSDFDDQFRTVVGQAEKAVTYNMLRREVESDRQLYETMLQRVREAGFASAMRDSTIRIVDPAPLPEVPVSPSIPGSIAGGLALGGLLGIGIVFLRDNNDRRIRRPDDVTGRLGIPELGVIPSVPGLSAPRLHPRSRFGMLEPPRRAAPLELLTMQHSVSSVAEAFRAAMNSVLFASGGEGSSRVIVVTSPGLRDGKTTFAVNLSAALAETGRRVLLVDADMRKPRLHEIMGSANTFGLHDVLTANAPVASFGIDRLVEQTDMRGLWLMPSGSPPTNISRLLHSPRLGELVARVRNHFDFVVLDTPPLIPVSDARLFARVSDGVLLVLRGNQTTHDDALRARNVLTNDGTPIIGTIFNDWYDARAQDYYAHDRGSAS